MCITATMKRSLTCGYSQLFKCQQSLLPSRVSSRHLSNNENPKMPPCDFKPQKYKGLPYERVTEIRKKHLSPALLTIYKKPILLHQGHMQWLFDSEGRRYLDLIAGIVTVSVGHCHPKVIEAAQKQLSRLWHTSNIYFNSPIHEYAEKLTALFPGKLKGLMFRNRPISGHYMAAVFQECYPFARTLDGSTISCHVVLQMPTQVLYLTNSGSEANDLAMYIARLHTKSFDIIGLRGGYHGASPYTLGVTAVGAYKQGIANGNSSYSTMNPDVFRGIWGGSHCRDSPVQTIRKCSCSPGCCEAKDRYIDQLKDTLNTCAAKNVAAFIAEPIQGVGGAVQYPKGFLKEAYELIRERGGLCIADEVQTGFGRTGSHYWGFQTHDVMPDIVTMAKGIGNGFPMGAVITTPEVQGMPFGEVKLNLPFENIPRDVTVLINPLMTEDLPEIAGSYAHALSFNTFGGNPIACSAASAVLDVIEEDGLQNNCKVVGTHMLLEFAKLRDMFDIVGDVRGKGLMIGIEMVTDKESRRPLPTEEMNRIWEDCREMGVLLGKGGLYSQTFRIKPPMCITKEDVDFGVAVFKKALTKHMERATK